MFFVLFLLQNDVLLTFCCLRDLSPLRVEFLRRFWDLDGSRVMMRRHSSWFPTFLSAHHVRWEGTFLKVGRTTKGLGEERVMDAWILPKEDGFLAADEETGRKTTSYCQRVVECCADLVAACHRASEWGDKTAGAMSPYRMICCF